MNRRTALAFLLVFALAGQLVRAEGFLCEGEDWDDGFSVSEEGFVSRAEAVPQAEEDDQEVWDFEAGSGFVWDGDLAGFSEESEPEYMKITFHNMKGEKEVEVHYAGQEYVVKTISQIFDGESDEGFLGWGWHSSDDREIEYLAGTKWDYFGAGAELDLYPVYGDYAVTYIVDNDKSTISYLAAEENDYAQEIFEKTVNLWVTEDGRELIPGERIENRSENLTLIAKKYTYVLRYCRSEEDDTVYAVFEVHNDGDPHIILNYLDVVPEEESEDAPGWRFVGWYAPGYRMFEPGEIYDETIHYDLVPYFEELYYVTYIVDGQIYAKDAWLTYEEPVRIRDVPAKDGSVGVGWRADDGRVFQAGRPYGEEADMILYAVYADPFVSPAPAESTTQAPSTEAPTESTTEAAPATEAPASEPSTEETTERPGETGVTVTLARPDRPAAKNVSHGIKLTWKAVEDALEYEVYRSQEGGSLKKIATTDRPAYVDEDVDHAVLYTYYVRAKSYTAGKVNYKTGGVSKGRRQIFVKRSGKVKISGKKGTIRWTAGKAVDGYQLLVADNKALKGGQKFTVGDVTKIYVKDIPQVSLLPAGTYYISIRQFIMNGKKRYVSAYHGKKKYIVR